jgi:excinuclease ABC subunit A
MESLSTYARQFLEKQEKPEVDSIEGLAPTIAIEQKNHTKNSRSTVGTATEIYDYLRLLYAKIGIMYDPVSGEVVKKDLVRDVVQDHLTRNHGQRAYVLFPFQLQSKSKIEERKLSVSSLLERGFTRAFIERDLKLNKEATLLDIQEEISSKKTRILGKAASPHCILVMTDRFVVDDDSRGRMEEALVSAYAEGFGRAQIVVVDSDGILIEQKHYTDYPSTGTGEKRFPEMSPLLFSFNSPMGACESCRGFGSVLRVDPDLVIPNKNLSIAQGAVDPFSKPSGREWLKELVMFCRSKKIPLNVPWADLTDVQKKILWEGEPKNYEGIRGVFEGLESERYKKSVRMFLSRYRSPQKCLDCNGHRLRAEARNVFIKGKSIGELSSLTIRDLKTWLDSQNWNSTEQATAKEIFAQIQNRLDFLMRVGLDYLSLDRLTKTLSGGEAQRIALANQLGTRLTQTCYVLDEPSIGLHPRDTDRLISILKDLAKLKNTVVVVEHDPDIIQNADYLVDLGPRAGEDGGQLVFQGPYSDFMKKVYPDSATQPFVMGTETLQFPERRRMDRFADKKKRVQWIELTKCSEHNLQNVNLRIPRGMLTCVTGVSGSGKSTAIRKTFYPALARILMAQVEEVGPFEKITGFEGLDSILMIDQSPIGRSPRSNPITFMKGFDSIRELLASTHEARRAGYHAGHFSFNVPGGRCEACEGEGYVRVEMVFMEDMFVKCDVCDGKRYKKEILGIQYNGKNVNDILHMTVNEAKKFFQSEKRLYHILYTLEQVGLGYLRLGQASNTLSGGESQRLKIARELIRSDTSKGVYVLDEPTTGLHFRDIGVLLKTLDELVERGNTVVVIEHNLDVMRASDWIVDFGPEGGDKGGQIVFEGTPEDLIKMKNNHTADYLKRVLK